MRALDLARQGWKQRDIAVALDASEGAVSRGSPPLAAAGRKPFAPIPPRARPPSSPPSRSG